MLYSVNEFSFDRFHKNGDNIFRVYQWSEAKGEEVAGGKVYHPMPLGPAMKQELRVLKNYCSPAGSKR
jgi:putative ABC transport system permease protein